MDNSTLLESSFEVSGLPELPSLVRIDRNEINLKLVKSLHMSDHEVTSVGEYRVFVYLMSYIRFLQPFLPKIPCTWLLWVPALLRS